MSNSPMSHIDLQAMARQVMIQYGFQPEFSPSVEQQLAQISKQPSSATGDVRDLRHLLWSSIDNDTSRDLDQIEYAETLPDGSTRVLIGIADVDAYVAKGSAIDQHAAIETVTIYTGVKNFSMLPDELSTGLTSLLEGQDRACIVTEFTLDKDTCATETCIASSKLYPALVNNKAQLAYNGVGAWLDNHAAPPPKIAASKELQAQ